MAWFKGTSTDYQDFMDILKNLVKDDHISAASVVNGGTGYALNDIITLSGGTKYHEPEIRVLGVNSGDYVSNVVIAAGGTGYAVGDKIVPAAGTFSVPVEIEVLTLSGSAVATVQINNPGICSAQPSNPVSTTSDGAGTGCTLTLTFTAGTGIITSIHISDSGVYTTQATNPVSQNTSDGSGTGAKFEVTYTDTAWETLIDYEEYEATAVAISTAGTGYTAGDVVTLTGGLFTVGATVTVDTVSGGVPTAVSVSDGGEYQTTPSNPASTSGGTGSGLTITATWSLTTLAIKYLMIHNTTTDVYLGWRGREYTGGAEDAYYIENTGFTGINTSSTPWAEQPGFTGYYCKTPLSGGASPATINYWVSVSDRRIAATFKVGSAYPNMYAGLIDPFLTAAEYSYPSLILGCCTDPIPSSYSGLGYSGMNNPAANSAADVPYGPGQLRLPDGSYESVVNWYESGGDRTKVTDRVFIFPGHDDTISEPSGANGWYNASALRSWQAMWNGDIVLGSSQDFLGRIASEFVLVPCTLVSSTIGRVFGSMAGVFCINPDGDIISEDTVLVNGDVYRVFQNCAKANRNYFFAIKEE